MRILLDTNIFISREDHAILPTNLQSFLNLVQRVGIHIVLHPLSVEEIQRDTDSKRKEVDLSKIRTYPMIEQPPVAREDTSFVKLVGPFEDEHELVDANLLYCVLRDTVDFLVTEDRGIHAKAKQIGLSHRVLTIDQAESRFQALFRINPASSPPALVEVPAHNLDLNDPIFDSLMRDYANTTVPFTEWWKKICREGRKAWVYKRGNGPIGALLLYKIENEAIPSDPPIPAGRKLKVSTIKVAPSEQGQNIGELFVKIAIDFAVKNDIFVLYLTHFSKPDDYLVNLIEGLGFSKTSQLDGEDVYLKKLLPDATSVKPLEISRKFYPSFYDGKLVKKFIVPILPNYHDRLFTEYAHRQTMISEYGGTLIVEGNPIKKAYLSHSKLRGMNPGDILLFYRSQDLHQIVSLGVVENVYHSQDPERIKSLVRKRTVYRDDEINELAKKQTKIILFRWHFHISKPLALNYLLKNHVLTQAPQTMVRIPHKKYMEMKEDCGIDKRFTVN